MAADPETTIRYMDLTLPAQDGLNASWSEYCAHMIWKGGSSVIPELPAGRTGFVRDLLSPVLPEACISSEPCRLSVSDYEPGKGYDMRGGSFRLECSGFCELVDEEFVQLRKEACLKTQQAVKESIIELLETTGDH